MKQDMKLYLNFEPCHECNAMMTELSVGDENLMKEEHGD